MVFTHGPSADLPCLATRAGLGRITRNSDVAHFVHGGVVKTFRWAIDSMLFRIWFYACKIAIIGFAVFAVGFATSRQFSRILQMVGLAIVIPVVIFCAILGIAACFGLRSACPFCGTRGLWVQYGHGIGLVCNRCGVVYGNPILQSTLRADSDVDADDSDTSSDD